MHTLLLLSFLLFSQAHAQDRDCDFFQTVNPTTTYKIQSPGYPNYYPRSKTCRWIAQCPTGYQCRLDCYLEMALTSGCSGDKLYISRTGDPQLVNAETYCGRQTLTGILSVNSQISVALESTSTSPGGRFTCDLKAQAASQPACRCGVKKQNRIVGGTQTGPNEYTMMAGLIENSGLILCGAVIISESYVMTAAHCLIGRSPNGIMVSIGDRNLTAGIIFRVLNFVTHPQYNSDNYDYDIGLVRVAGTIPMTANISPVCLPFKQRDTNIVGLKLVLLGWGTTSFGGPTSSILLKTDVSVVSQSRCRSITDRQICTLTPGKDACQNDSGGPALYIDPLTGRVFSFGIISYGTACGTNTASVQTRVVSTEILRWIVNTASSDYCVVE